MKIIILSLLLISNLSAKDKDTLFTAFWNLENLFDTVDDPDKDDEEFLPSGVKEWSDERLDKKFFNSARVIRSMNNGNGPDILGVCEVEHQGLLDDMITKFLDDRNYKTAYAESPDKRGIDNGLIFNASKLSLLSVSADTVHLPDNYPTRLILSVTFLYYNKDTLVVFVNHWPSRRGGGTISEPNRIAAAQILKARIDILFKDNPEAKIIVMGDFNDEPGNESLLNHLMASPVKCDSVIRGIEQIGAELLNLAYSSYEKGDGSYKYQDQWNMLDQIIVSSSFFKNGGVQYLCDSFEIYKPDMLLTKSGKFEGTPFPTYGGRRYLGGYSDHFPVTAKFIFKEIE